jgi:hypothetical protein
MMYGQKNIRINLDEVNSVVFQGQVPLFYTGDTIPQLTDH